MKLNIIPFLLIFFSGASMSKELLDLRAYCVDDASCKFREEDIRVELTISNPTSRKIGFPIDYLKARGPAITLTDNISGRKLPLKLSLASDELLNKYHFIESGQFISMTIKIRRSEILWFGEPKVDITATIQPAVDIKTHDDLKPVPFRGQCELRIVGFDDGTAPDANAQGNRL